MEQILSFFYRECLYFTSTIKGHIGRYRNLGFISLKISFHCIMALLFSLRNSVAILIAASLKAILFFTLAVLIVFSIDSCLFCLGTVVFYESRAWNLP